MSSSSINNLRRAYNQNQNGTNYNKNKHQNINHYQNDYILQNTKLKQTPYLNKSLSNKKQASYLNKSFLNKLIISNKQNQSQIINQSSSIKNNIIKQQNTFEINRYLKQYQYNCYKLSDTTNQSLNSLHYQNNKKLPLNNITNLNQQNHNKSYNIKSNSFHSQISQLSHNYLYNKSKSSFNQQIINNSYQEIIPIKKLIFDQQQNTQNQINNSSFYHTNSLQNLNNSLKIYSKDQITLIKCLRSQIDDLFVQINNKDAYIKKLQQKLQSYLVERIEVQNFIQQNTRILQANVYQSQKQQQRILEQYKQAEYKLRIYEEFIKKLNECLFNDQKYKNIDYKQIEEAWINRQNILQRLQELNRCRKLVMKMQQMKIKIQINKDLKQNNQLSNYEYNQTKQKKINLYELWKWIKTIGKQYQIMKWKVNSFKHNITH